jgi:hypothetical protein
MSTTFEVYPGVPELPTFGALVERSTTELHRFLESVNITNRPAIDVKLQTCKEHAQRPLSFHNPLRWDKNTVYAWFSVGNVVGGTDAYFGKTEWLVREFWESELQSPKYAKMEAAIRKGIAIGHYWWFRRSMGQPAIVNLAYGLIAGSLASLTNGIVYSSDSAWDWERMPAFPDEFLSWYFRPEKALEENFREWSKRSIEAIKRELGE